MSLAYYRNVLEFIGTEFAKTSIWNQAIWIRWGDELFKIHWTKYCQMVDDLALYEELCG